MSWNNRDLFPAPTMPNPLINETIARKLPEQSETSKLLERVEKLISLLEEPSSIIITGKKAEEMYNRLIDRN